MANTKSALKRARQSVVRTARNRSVLSKVKTLRKKIDTLVAEGDAKAAQAAYDEFSSAIDKAAKGSVVHANKAANLKSRAAKALKQSA